MKARKLRLLIIGASFLALCDAAMAERVKWRIAGVVGTVGPNASALPFAVKVGQPFIIEMEFENSSMAAGAPGPDMATYNNELKATGLFRRALPRLDERISGHWTRRTAWKI